MELRELETFRAVVDAGGVARAADRLNRAQSSVTARIRQLEASLGVPLFDREGRSLRLTAAGDALLGYADRMLGLAAEARVAVRSDVVGGRLRLGSMESTAASRLPHPLAAFHRNHPGVSVELQTAPSRELVARVQARTLDAAIVGDEVDDEQFVRVPLYVEELVLVGAADRAPTREPRQFAGTTLLVFHGNGCTYRRRFEQWLQVQRVAPGRILEFASYHAILASAAAGVGVSLVPRSVLDIYPQREAVSITTMPRQMSRIRTALVMQRGRHVPALTQLANHLRDDARRAARGK